MYHNIVIPYLMIPYLVSFYNVHIHAHVNIIYMYMYTHVIRSHDQEQQQQQDKDYRLLLEDDRCVTINSVYVTINSTLLLMVDK